MTQAEVDEALTGFEAMDWQQIVLNGGPPCFHISDMEFCLRAERWDGHKDEDFHAYVSLRDLVDRLRTVE